MSDVEMCTPPLLRCRGCKAPVADLASAHFVQHKSVNAALVIQRSDLKAPNKWLMLENTKKFKIGEMRCGNCDQDLGNVHNNVGAEGFRGKNVGLLKHKAVEFPLPMDLVREKFPNPLISPASQSSRKKWSDPASVYSSQTSSFRCARRIWLGIEG